MIAGNAPPGSEVRILDGDTMIGKVKADERGEWVFVPDQPLDPGSRKLSLQAITNGGKEIASAEDVVIVVPERTQTPGAPEQKQAMVLKFPKAANAPTKIIQNPAGPVDRSEFPLTIDTLDYDTKGHVIIGGGAPKGATVQLYLDGELIARTTSDDDGPTPRAERVQWSKFEDATIVQSVEELGHKWYLIAQRLPGRTDHAIRNRYHRLQSIASNGHRRSFDSLDAFDSLAAAPILAMPPVLAA